MRGSLRVVSVQCSIHDSPPLATAAYYLKAVAPDWTLTDIHWGMAEFMVQQLVGLLLVMLFPAVGLWLPHWLYGK